MYETLTLHRDPRGVATLTLNRPDKHNALSETMIAEVTDAAARLGSDPSVRVVLLTGAGRSFCAGGDLGWMQAQFDADRPTRMAQARGLAHMLRDLDQIPKPLIARVNGTAMGGGLGLMAVCDIVVAADAGRFGFTETRLGLIPATISPYVLARMGQGAARSVMASSRIFGAADLPGLNLAHRVVAPDDLDAAVAEAVAPYLTAAPQAVAATKALIRAIGGVTGDAVSPEAIDASIEALADTWEGPEARAGVAAFFDGTPAPWA